MTIVANPRGHQDVLAADVFSWTELPELMAAEELFDAASFPNADGRAVVARGDEDEDEEEDEDDFDDDEDEWALRVYARTWPAGSCSTAYTVTIES